MGKNTLNLRSLAKVEIVGPKNPLISLPVTIIDYRHKDANTFSKFKTYKANLWKSTPNSTDKKFSKTILWCPPSQAPRYRPHLTDAGGMWTTHPALWASLGRDKKYYRTKHWPFCSTVPMYDERVYDKEMMEYIFPERHHKIAEMEIQGLYDK